MVRIDRAPLCHREGMAAEVRVLTWNLQGSKGLDVDAVGTVIGAAAPDVIVLQEVQRGQARRLAATVGATSTRWTFKHWPVVSRAEGLAVLSRHPCRATQAYVVRRAPPWSWRRRVALDADVDVDGLVCTVADVHLSPHGVPAVRAREIDIVLGRRRSRAPIVAGDLNDDPDGPAHASLVAAGWIDAWAARHGGGSGATNWTVGARIGRAPTQRLDYVFAPAGWTIVACDVVAAPIEDMAALSDHLPVVATVRPPDSPG